MAHIVRFEIHASDTARARAFYGELFGWTFRELPSPGIEHWLIMTGGDGAIQGGLLKRPGPTPTVGQSVNSFICTLGGIENVDTTVAKAVELGAIVAMPKMAVPGSGWLAYIIAPDGNLLGLFQDDTKAH